MLRIITTLGCTVEEIEQKAFNIWIGISLGNKSFTKKLIQEYLVWALEYSASNILVLIPARLHAINLEVLEDRSKLGAYKKAHRLADEKKREIEELVKSIPIKEQKRIHVVGYQHSVATKYHEYREEVLIEEFEKKREFYLHVLELVKANLKKGSEISIKDVEKLARYVLLEIPLFLNGVFYEGHYYTLIPYPGLNNFDELLIGLQDGSLFPELSSRLKIERKIQIVEAYAD